MPYKDRETELAARATPEFKKRNYEHVKAWRKKPESKAKRAAEAKRWRERYPEKWQEIKTRFRVNNIERIRERDAEAQRKRRAADPEGQKRRMAEFKAREEAKRTEIAGRPRPETCDLCNDNIGGICFDHCHATDTFRGWICDRCNKVLGLVNDNVELLRRMIDYLRGPHDRRVDMSRYVGGPNGKITEERSNYCCPKEQTESL